MTKEQAAETKRLRDAKKPCKECKSEPGVHAPGCSIGKANAAADAAAKAAAPKDLADAEVQAKILSPEPFPVTFGGKGSSLYPLPANTRCDITLDFWPSVLETARTMGDLGFTENMDGGQKVEVLLRRCARAMIRNAPLKERFTRFLARAESKPSAEPDAALLEARAALIDRACEPDELLLALTRIYVTEIIRPKAITQPAK